MRIELIKKLNGRVVVRMVVCLKWGKQAWDFTDTLRNGFSNSRRLLSVGYDS